MGDEVLNFHSAHFLYRLPVCLQTTKQPKNKGKLKSPFCYFKVQIILKCIVNLIRKKNDRHCHPTR